MASYYRSMTCLIVLLMQMPMALSEELRTWKDSSGSFSVEAKFVSQNATSVTLRTGDERDIAVPLAKLSREDRQYLAQLKPPQSDRPKVQPAIADTLANRLATKADFQFSQSPLTEVLQSFRDDHGLPVLLDQSAIESAGISTSASISFVKKSVPVGDAFAELLKSLSLQWTIDRGVVVVTTFDGAEHRLSTRVYRIKSGANPAALMRDITQSMEPHSWESLGGPCSIIPLPPRSIIVRQRHFVHQQIASKYVGKLMLVPHQPYSLNALRVNVPVESLTKTLSLDITNQRLSEVATRMSDAAKIEIKVDEQSIQSVGLSLDSAFTINLPELPLLDVASHLFEPMGLTLSIQDQEIYITTEDGAASYLIPANYKTGALNPEQLRLALMSTASPSSWDVLGGPGSIKNGPGGSLEIQQTLDVHVEIAQILSDL